MFKIYKKLWLLLDKNEKNRFYILLFLMILMSFLEIIGVGSIAPFLSVLANSDTIETNYYLYSIYNYLNFQDKKSFLIFLGLSSLFFLLLSAGVRSFTTYLKFKFSNIQRHRIGTNLLNKYLNESYSFFLKKNSSDISKNILSETDLVIVQAIIPSLDLIAYSILSFSLILFLIYIDPFLALILSCILGGFYFIVFLFFKRRISFISEGRSRTNTERFRTISETIGGIKDIKILGKEELYLDSFKNASSKFSYYNTINNTIGEIPQFLAEVLAFGSLLILTLIILINNNEISTILPLLGLYAIAALKLKPALNLIYKSVTKMKFGISALNNVIEDLNNKNLNYKKSTEKRLNINNLLHLKNIDYFYENTEKATLKNINILIRANTTIGIIGKTGSGKSTLLDVILGLLTQSSGEIKIDNNLLTNENIREWQNNIGYVSQNIYLADTTIINNIAFGIKNEEINYERVKEVSKMAQVDEFVSTLEQKYKTSIGERGVRLSGGQRQRLGIARALYHDPQILILDEATSALDNKTELEVMKSIENMAGTRTIIMVAHRLSTIKRCDQIIELENGVLKNVQ